MRNSTPSKLEAPHRNTWLYKSKDGINACVGSTANEIIDIYDKAVSSPRGELKRTGLIYGGLDLWTDDTRYMGIRISHLDMSPHQAVIQKSEACESVIVDDKHIFTVASQESTECRYLWPLGQGGK